MPSWPFVQILLGRELQTNNLGFDTRKKSLFLVWDKANKDKNFAHCSRSGSQTIDDFGNVKNQFIRYKKPHSVQFDFSKLIPINSSVLYRVRHSNFNPLRF